MLQPEQEPRNIGALYQQVVQNGCHRKCTYDNCHEFDSHASIPLDHIESHDHDHGLVQRIERIGRLTGILQPSVGESQESSPIGRNHLFCAYQELIEV